MDVAMRLVGNEFVYTFPRGTRVTEVVLSLSPWMRMNPRAIRVLVNRNSPGASQWRFEREGTVVKAIPPTGFTVEHEEHVTVEMPVGVGVTQRYN